MNITPEKVSFAANIDRDGLKLLVNGQKFCTSDGFQFELSYVSKNIWDVVCCSTLEIVDRVTAPVNVIEC